MDIVRSHWDGVLFGVNIDEVILPIEQIDGFSFKEPMLQFGMHDVNTEIVEQHFTNLSCLGDTTQINLHNLTRPNLGISFFSKICAHAPKLSRLVIIDCVIEKKDIDAFFESLSTIAQLESLETHGIKHEDGSPVFVTNALVQSLPCLKKLRNLSIFSFNISSAFITPIFEALLQMPAVEQAILSITNLNLPAFKAFFSYFFSTRIKLLVVQFFRGPEGWRIEEIADGIHMLTESKSVGEDMLTWTNTHATLSRDKKARILKSAQLYDFLCKHGTVLPVELMIRIPTIISQKPESELIMLKKYV